MMGQQSGLQEQLFYEFRLDGWIPVDHLLRKIDAVLDLGSLRHELAPFYSHTGRPSVDPELMVRMLLVGYCYGIRIGLSRAVAPRRQTEVRPHISRSRETPGVVDAGSISQSYDCADTRNGHQLTAYGIPP